MVRAFLSLGSEKAPSRPRGRPATTGGSSKVLRLQRLAGNSAVQRILTQRAIEDGGGGAHEQAEVEAAAAALDSLLDPEAIAASLGGVEASGSSGLEETTAQALVQRLSVQRQPSPPAGETGDPKPGAAGDVLKAVAETEEFKQAAARVKMLAADKLKTDWGKLKTGEKAAVVISGFSIVGGGLAGALIKPESRKFLESQISGVAIPVPGVNGLSLTLDVKDDKLTGGMVNFNVGAALPKSWGFQ